jgi:transposase
LDLGTGEVATGTRKRHTAKDVLAFFELIDLDVARELEIHLVLDNLSAHKAPGVMKWLVDPKRARWYLHFTPTSSSWLNLVERWSKELADRRVHKGILSSVSALVEAIEIWAEHWNDDPKPFIWHKAADDIIGKVCRARLKLHQINPATDH